MSSSINFTGTGFVVESVSQPNLATVRIKYTQDPLAVSATGVNDALNPTNYTLSGPTLAIILSCSAVGGDPQSIDLNLIGPLNQGAWTVSVHSNVQETDGSSITAPAFAVFTVGILVQPESVPAGATTDLPEDILRKHFNPALKGSAWTAILHGIGIGEQYNLDNAISAFDQLFLSSANGIYLERKAGDNGIQKPPNIGMSDSLFRKYAIGVTNNQLTEISLLQLMAIFYGEDSVRAHVDSGNTETFAIMDGDDLQIVIDENAFITCTFLAADFAIPGRALALELAAALNRSFEINDSNAYAEPLVDPQTGLTHLRIYSSSQGLGSSVRIAGGRAQNVLQFPTQVLAFSGLPVWNITTLPAMASLRFSPDSTVDMSQVRIGDYVTVYGLEFNVANRGTYTITNVYWAYPGGTLTQYFDVINAFGVAQSGLTQAAANDLLIWRPTKATTHDIQARAVQIASIGDNVDVVLPATSQAVNRGPNTAAYGQVNASIAIQTLERQQGGIVTVTTPTPHGLSVNDQILIEGVYGSPVIPATNNGSYTTGAGTSDTSKGSIWTATAGTSHPAYVNGIAIRLLDGSVFHGGGYSLNAGTLVDDGFYWNRLYVSSETTQASGTKTVVWSDLDAGAGSNTLVRQVNFPAASLGINPLFFYGQVMMTGGESSFASVRQAWQGTQIWSGPSDPTVGAGRVTAGPAMLDYRAAHKQTTLNAVGQAYHGGFFVTGGMGIQYNRAQNTTERYSPADTTWTHKASMLEPRAQHQLISLQDGRVLAVGGRPLNQGHAVEADTVDLWRFDSLTTTIPDLGPFNLPLTDVNSPAINNGESGFCRTYTGTAYSGRSVVDAALGSLLFTGTYTVEGWFNDLAHASSGAICSFEAALDGTANTNSVFGFGITGGEYKVYWMNGLNVVQAHTTSGGQVAATATKTWNHFAVTSQFQPLSSSWFQQIYINGVFVYSFTATSLPTGGGATVVKWSVGRGPSNVIATKWTGGVDDLRISSTAHDANRVYNTYLAASGELYYSDPTRIGPISRTSEIYDPTHDSWVASGSMACARFNHRCVQLTDGRVLAVGGIGFDPKNPTTLPIALTTAEFWNPVTGAWSSAGNTSWARDSAVVEYIAARNQVVVVGGSDLAGSIHTEIFDTIRGKWSVGSATLLEGVAGAKGALLGTDLIALVGGYDSFTGNSHPTSYAAGFLNIYIPNADQFFGPGLNGNFAVSSVVSSTVFQYITNEPQYTLNASTSATITPLKALASSIPGPFVFDPHAGVAITDQTSTTVSALNIHQQYGYVDVVDATQFPDAPGWLVFAFGYANQVGPVRYLGRLSNTRLSLDYAFRFPAAIPAGASVTGLLQKGPWVPARPEKVGSFYITDSPAGRVAAQNAIESIVAAGVNVSIAISYPGDRGISNEGYPTHGFHKLTDMVGIFSGDDEDSEVAAARVS